MNEKPGLLQQPSIERQYAEHLQEVTFGHPLRRLIDDRDLRVKEGDLVSKQCQAIFRRWHARYAPMLRGRLSA